MTPSPTRPAPRRASARKGVGSSRGPSPPPKSNKKPDKPSGKSGEIPSAATAVLVLADGGVFPGHGAGASGVAEGELCFNTAMTGYQEILTDPSYAGQIICFTFPHIGNTGANDEDMESLVPAARGLVLRASITEAANFRASGGLDQWLKAQKLIAVTGVDTRKLTHRLRQQGAVNGVVAHDPDGKFEGGKFDLDALRDRAASAPSMEGLDLAREVTCEGPFEWDQTCWALGRGHGQMTDPKRHVVAMDFGAKHNILRCLADLGCRVSVVTASTAAADILAYKPDGIFLSNGPGDPAATGQYAVPVIRELVASGLSIFGICLGHQMLALALGAETRKMHHGHRGANHPVKDLETGKVEITSQNHGFVVDADTLPEGVTATHMSLFDGSLEGLMVEDKPVFSVQYHPEASPGPHDAHYLFKRFIAMMKV